MHVLTLWINLYGSSRQQPVRYRTSATHNRRTYDTSAAERVAAEKASEAAARVYSGVAADDDADVHKKKATSYGGSSTR